MSNRGYSEGLEINMSGLSEDAEDNDLGERGIVCVPEMASEVVVEDLPVEDSHQDPPEDAAPEEEEEEKIAADDEPLDLAVGNSSHCDRDDQDPPKLLPNGDRDFSDNADGLPSQPPAHANGRNVNFIDALDLEPMEMEEPEDDDIDGGEEGNELFRISQGIFEEEHLAEQENDEEVRNLIQQSQNRATTPPVECHSSSLQPQRIMQQSSPEFANGDIHRTPSPRQPSQSNGTRKSPVKFSSRSNSESEDENDGKLWNAIRKFETPQPSESECPTSPPINDLENMDQENADDSDDAYPEDDKVALHRALFPSLLQTMKNHSRPHYLEKCAKCSVKADFVCRGCFRVAYCSEEHQREDWSGHSRYCIRYSLDRHPNLVQRGPFYLDSVTVGPKRRGTDQLSFEVIAKMDISPGTTLLEEKPFLLSPWPKAKHYHLSAGKFLPPGLIIRYLSCFGCGKVLGFSYVQCRNCKLFLCSHACRHVSIHKENECEIIQQLLTPEEAQKNQDPRLNLQKIYNESVDHRLLYIDVMILRLILKLDKLKQSLSEEKFKEEWAKLNEIWKTTTFERMGEEKLDMQNGLAYSFGATRGNRQLLWQLYSIVKLNSFSLELPFRRFRALCVFLGNMTHKCMPNCQAFLKEPGVEKYDAFQEEESPENLTVVVRTGKDIRRGETLTFSYVPLILGNLQRSRILKEEYDIKCKCLRCMDSSECGTFCTNIKCGHCGRGVVIPVPVKPKPPLISQTAKEKITDIKKLEKTEIKWECRVIIGRRLRPPQPPSFSTGHCVTITNEAAMKKSQEMNIILFAILTKPSPYQGYLNVLKTYKLGPSQVYHYYFHILRLCEDLIRGELLPFPDILADDLSEFSNDALELFLLAKGIYLDFMKKFIPDFVLEGFPVANYELIENELQGRKREANIQPRNNNNNNPPRLMNPRNAAIEIFRRGLLHE